ncbi:hypothetical protein CARUB_v10013934mg [Capsella rubella]|uniref:F-box domain-containing protein n=1 Tax=Capsella rubella TaxID=81985 RepID=R0G5W1_9BRAS|nr:F-box protein ETP2 [Capsella rubella]EOA30791.1 hypothetical protein CARUB_v10013934mg [Capsella rubella]
MAIPDLHNDLVEEILCRVPARNLKRLRGTSKRWNRLLKDDGRLAREHCDKATKEFVFLMLKRISPMSVCLPHGDALEVKTVLVLPDPRFNNSQRFDGFEVVHCDGLLLCYHHGTILRQGSQFVVWNPLTGQARWIESKGGAFGFGYKKSSCRRKSYKVLSFSAGTNNSEIYDFDSDSWRLVDHDIAPGFTLPYSRSPSVSFKGNIYWIAKQVEDESIHLLRFDFSTEKSQRLPLPCQSLTSYLIAFLSCVREDKLSTILQLDRNSKTEIWVTDKIDDETTKAISWTKLFALDFDCGRWYIPHYGRFLLDEDKKVVVWLEQRTDLVDYSKTIIKISILGEDNNLKVFDFGVDTYAPVIFSYAPSFLQVERPQIKRPGGKRKRGE